MDENKHNHSKKKISAPDSRKGLSTEDWVLVAGATCFVLFLWLIGFIFFTSRQIPSALPPYIIEAVATRGFILPPTWTPGPTQEFIPSPVGTAADSGIAPTRIYTPRPTSLSGVPMLVPNIINRGNINTIDLARIMQGESTGDKDAAYYVGWVAKNRLLHEGYGDTYAMVSSGFFGYKANINPSNDFLEIAIRIIRAKEDPTNGCLYALSRTDITNLGIPPHRADVTRGEWFFFRTWPLNGR